MKNETNPNHTKSQKPYVITFGFYNHEVRSNGVTIRKFTRLINSVEFLESLKKGQG